MRKLKLLNKVIQTQIDECNLLSSICKSYINRCVCVCARVCTHVLSNLLHVTRKETTRVEERVREKGVRKK